MPGMPGIPAIPPTAAFNWLSESIKKFADVTNKKAGEFYTPRSVVKTLVEMLEPYKGVALIGRDELLQA